jgi:hypothetical protein
MNIMRSKLQDDTDSKKKQQLNNLTKMYLKVIEEQKPEVVQTVPRMTKTKTNQSKSPLSVTKVPQQCGVFRKKDKKDDTSSESHKVIELSHSDFLMPFSVKEIRELIPKTPSESFIDEETEGSSKLIASNISTEQKDKIQKNLSRNIQEFSDAVVRSRSKSDQQRQLETSSPYSLSFYKTTELVPSAHRQKDKEKLSIEPDININIVQDYQKKIKDLENHNLELISQISSYRSITTTNIKESVSEKELDNLNPAINHLFEALNVFMEKIGEEDIITPDTNDPVEAIYELSNYLISKTYITKKKQIDNGEELKKFEFQSQSEIPESDILPSQSVYDDAQNDFEMFSQEKCIDNDKNEFEDKMRKLLIPREAEDESELEDHRPELQTRKLHLSSSLDLIPTFPEISNLNETYQLNSRDRSRIKPAEQISNDQVHQLMKEVLQVKKQLRRIESNMLGIVITPQKSEEMEPISFNISGIDASFRDV